MSTATPASGNMIAQSLLPEFDHEMANTRKALERLRDDKFNFKPHERSNNMGWLAAHLANLASWGQVTLKEESFDVKPVDGPAYDLPMPATRDEVLELFDKNAATTRAAIEACSDQSFLQPWTLLAGGQTIFTMPRIAVLRGMILNHMIHHRGQLTVYLRMNDLPVPALYGPSADEQA